MTPNEYGWYDCRVVYRLGKDTRIDIYEVRAKSPFSAVQKARALFKMDFGDQTKAHFKSFHVNRRIGYED